VTSITGTSRAFRWFSRAVGNFALAITDDHRDLADAANGQLSRLHSLAAARATLDGGSEGGSNHPAGLWSAAADVGWQGLAVAEEYGGSGFGLSELAVVLEAQGRELCPGPFLPTVAAAVVIDRCAPDSVRAQLLPGLADGTVVGALGLSGSVTVGSDLTVAGESPAVLGAPDAAVLAVIAGDDVVLVDADADGVTVTALSSLDTTRSIGSVALRNVAVAEERVLRGAGRRARTVFRILASAEAVGISWATLDMAVEYAKVREQFGRTIGTFQAVKHHAANMLVNAEQTTAATWALNISTWTAPGSQAPSRRHTPSGPRYSTRSTTFSCTAVSGSRGSTTRTCTCGGPARWRPSWQKAPSP